jgi:hypothetical protein
MNNKAIAGDTRSLRLLRQILTRQLTNALLITGLHRVTISDNMYGHKKSSWIGVSDYQAGFEHQIAALLRQALKDGPASSFLIAPKSNIYRRRLTLSTTSASMECAIEKSGCSTDGGYGLVIVGRFCIL